MRVRERATKRCCSMILTPNIGREFQHRPTRSRCRITAAELVFKGNIVQYVPVQALYEF